MSQFKEFQGKTLDEAIKDACEYYGVPREKLEIEILTDAKSGIFGLVGAKKASIRAARMQLDGSVSSLLQPEEPGTSTPGRPSAPGGDSGASSAPKPRNAARPSLPRTNRSPVKTLPEKAATSEKASEEENRPRKGPRPQRDGSGKDKPQAMAPAARRERTPVPKGRGRSEPHAAVPGADAVDAAFKAEDLPEFDLSCCDPQNVADVVREVLLRLVEPIVGAVPCSVEIEGKRLLATLDSGDAAGLLVGRDGLTLSALQYLASRIVARKLGGSIRLHINAGNYRERQEDKLRELALSLADKARETGRPQSTRPLSAYQRRVVHLALEEQPDVGTRSKGEGAQRRVIIYLQKVAG